MGNQTHDLGTNYVAHKCSFYLLTMCIYVNSLIDGPLKITFVGDTITIIK